MKSEAGRLENEIIEYVRTLMEEHDNPDHHNREDHLTDLLGEYYGSSLSWEDK